MSIEDLRDKIDEIDGGLVPLFTRRMELSEEIAALKQKEGRPVTDPERERKLLAKVSDEAGEKFAPQTRALYNLILSLSRARQNELLEGDDPLISEIERAVESTPRVFPERASVACQGVEGAYSQLACEKIFPFPDIMFLSSFAGVFSAVENGLCRYGILPVENSTAGSVNQIYDLMYRHNFFIVRSARLHVSHCLLAAKGAALSDIREIRSHEQAINQCGKFLSTLKGVTVRPCENTAAAARDVARDGRRDLAAISSANCAPLYGLDIIREGIADVDSNFTRFICISKTPEIYPGADRTSLMLVLPHKPGSLYSILSMFYAEGINLLKLESRPIPGRDFEFMFYFDIDVPVDSPKFTRLLSGLRAASVNFRYFGSYREAV